MTDQATEHSPDARDFHEALARIAQSEVFKSSPRLTAFLTYIVEETVSGRGAEIRGKNIATDVYARSLDEGEAALNLVRVEAGRLRRALDEYYASGGASDPVCIAVELGSYRPTIRRPNPESSEPNDEMELEPWINRSAFIQLAALICAFSLGAFAFGIWPSSPSMVSVTERQSAERAALRANSIPSLQAANYAEEARGMFFPLFDVKRQRLALGMFEHVIELDPNLPLGYAGRAQVLATLSMLTPETSEAAALLGMASESADQAMSLGPTEAWSHAAQAWVSSLEGNTSMALEHAEVALQLAPADGHILDLVGISAIIIGNAKLAAEVSDPERPRTGPGRFGAHNIWGVSQLVLGLYPETIEAFATAPEVGAPISAPSLVFTAAAYRGLGDFDSEKAVLREYRETWPEFPGEYLVKRIFRSSPTTQELILASLKS